MTSLSTHVLDTSLGTPASGIAVTLSSVESGVAKELARGVTNADGRVASFDAGLSAGAYRLCFDVGAYFAASSRESFYGTVCVDFVVASGPQHYHVPLLLSPFGYSTYRGS